MAHRKFSPKKTLKIVLPAVFFCIMTAVVCSGSNGSDRSTDDDSLLIEVDPDSESETIVEDLPLSEKDLSADTVSRHLQCLDSMPEPTVKMKVNYVGRDLRKVFNDSNYVHWADGEKIGIKPLTDTRSHWKPSRDIVKITSCEDYFIDKLTYSRPYLVPQAAATLHEIGRRFRDTIAARGGGDYRIKVTSLLRTPRTVAKLRRRNSNAIDSSVHQLATTFDISYANFIANTDEVPRSTDDLKGVLAEVLFAMRNEGKIWVKCERRQPCFHITARPPRCE